MALGQEDQARQALEQVPAKIADHAEIAGARSALALAEEGRKAKGQLQSLQARVAADPADLQARYDLATALNAIGRARAGGGCAAGDHPAQPRAGTTMPRGCSC